MFDLFPLHMQQAVLPVTETPLDVVNVAGSAAPNPPPPPQK